MENTQALQENRAPILDTDAQRKERLLEKLFHEKSLCPIIRQCHASTKTYRKVIKYLNDEALAVHYIDHLTAITRSTKPRRAHVMDTEIDEDPFYAFMLSKVPQQYNLTKELFIVYQKVQE